MNVPQSAISTRLNNFSQQPKELTPIDDAKRLIRLGAIYDAKEVLITTLKNEDQEEFHLEANKEFVKLNLTDSVDNLRNYNANRSTSSFTDMSFALKQEHQSSHAQLANEYQKEAEILTNSLMFHHCSSTARKIEFAEALCITHLTIASALGHADSTYQLAEKYSDDKCTLPIAQIYEGNTAKAMRYAATARLQAIQQNDVNTLFKLGNFHEQNNSFFGMDATAFECYKQAADLGVGHAGACNKLAKYYENSILPSNRRLGEHYSQKAKDLDSQIELTASKTFSNSILPSNRKLSDNYSNKENLPVTNNMPEIKSKSVDKNNATSAQSVYDQF